MKTRRQLIAEDLARRAGKRFEDFEFDRRAPRGLDGLEQLRSIEDEKLRRSAWDLYWLLRAQPIEHQYKLPEERDAADESERRYP